MRRVVLFNTVVNSSNHGDKVIVDSLRRELRSILHDDFLYEIAPFDACPDARLFIRQADFCIHAGTNLLMSELEKKLSYPQWALEIPNLILCGVGWADYQRRPPSKYNLKFYQRVLGNGFTHSVRDSYTAMKLSAYHVPVINTGCPSLWSMTEDHCRRIPLQRAPNVLLTLTKFKRAPELDRITLETLLRLYERVYFWPAQYEDCSYLQDLGLGAALPIRTDLEGLDEFLSSVNADYVGTRLHAGIRALQHGRRSLLIGVDNRAIEMGRDYGLPVLPRKDVPTALSTRLIDTQPINIRMNQHAIRAWKAQLAPKQLPS